MATSRKRSPSRPLRADAQRSIDSVLDAALEALASDPGASMAEIARRAGVVRATIYVHFPTRDSLLDAIANRAVQEVTDKVAASEPSEGEPREALRRMLVASWRELGRFSALVPITMQRLTAEQFHELHRPFLALMAPLIVRGQASGAFRKDVPPSWHLTTLLAITHNASAELSAGRIPESEVEDQMVRTVLGALAP